MGSQGPHSRSVLLTRGVCVWFVCGACMCVCVGMWVQCGVCVWYVWCVRECVCGCASVSRCVSAHMCEHVCEDCDCLFCVKSRE